eukprot:1984832-Alexandrium_andersonii.AAC.1
MAKCIPRTSPWPVDRTGSQWRASTASARPPPLPAPPDHHERGAALLRGRRGGLRPRTQERGSI